ncbi:MAG: NrdH-redoxin, partial [Betaproteobacteria bacterium]|nr:NrdH-redoxin [Betaproteobacteria bacterium]
TGESLAVYAADVDQRLQKWWDELEDRSCSRTIKTYYGKQSIYVVYERSVWHSAQHVRQIGAVLERYGIEPADHLTKEDLAGLPMPEEIW